MPRQTISERFWSKVAAADENDCQLWTAALFDRGYGAFRVGNRQMKAHRVSWELTNGPIPDGLCVLHTCDNPPCVNPEHLFLGTDLDNAVDRESKGRGRYRHVSPLPPRPIVGRARGERHGRTPLTGDAVRAIRQACTAGETQQALADRYGVSQKAVSNIVRRLSWSHLD